MKKVHGIFLTTILILSSCRTSVVPPETPPASSGLPGPAAEAAATLRKATEEDRRIRSEAEAILSGMSLDEKIGQLFMLAMRHTTYGKPAHAMDAYLEAQMRQYRPGGIILFSINFQNPEQTRQLIEGLQEASPFPLFIATDEEGGKVSRLGKQENMQVISLPPARQLGKLNDPGMTRKAAAVLAADLRDLGFNMNMAPVADISRSRPPDVIGNRSFGPDPEQAGEMVAAAVEGFQENRISSVLKHFPGHGYVNGDTHDGMVKARGDKEEFETVDFIPFLRGIDAGADCIMTAHIQAPSLTGNSEPASLSRTIQTEILRKEMGFQGLIITDAMDMGAITRYWSPGEAALKAFLAGTDIILMPAGIAEARDYIKNAYINGEIPEKRLQDSLIRIVSTKIRRGLFDQNHPAAGRISPEKKEENHKSLQSILNLTVN